MRTAPGAAVLLLAALACLSCGGAGASALLAPGADLTELSVTRIEVDDQPFEVWLALTSAEQARGLMDAAPEQLLPAGDGAPRGMLFVFPVEQVVGFTMQDTYVPLDLAHFDAQGVLLEVLPLEPLVTTPVPSHAAVRYSLEVPRGTLAAFGIGPSSRLALPVP